MPESTPVNVLLVDDRPENLLALEVSLEPLGVNLVKAASGTEALRCLLRDDFALVLLDVQMPGMDGLEAARVIKQRERTRHVPIIFLTGSTTDPRHMFRGYEAGAVDYLYKPFDPHILRSKVSVFVDLHRLKREAEWLAHRALHDPLTGLANRVLFVDRVESALSRLTRTTDQMAVLFTDLDAFKAVNDRFGHDAGDRLLVEVAARLEGVVRVADSVARMGGDEFTVLCEGVTSAEETTLVAKRIIEEVSRPVDIGSASVSVSLSVGIALAYDPQHSPQSLISRADAAMYEAKEQGGGRWVVAGEGAAGGRCAAPSAGAA